jgi:hypothetical protein
MPRMELVRLVLAFAAVFVLGWLEPRMDRPSFFLLCLSVVAAVIGYVCWRIWTGRNIEA